MGLLDKFENRMDKLVNGAFAKAFKSEVQPVEIAAQLQKDLDERAAVVKRSRTVVPNVFVVSLSENDYERLNQFGDTLCAELAQIVSEYAFEQRYTFLGKVAVQLSMDPKLTTGIFHTTSQTVSDDTPQQPVAAAVPQAVSRTVYRPRVTVGTQEFLLPGATTVFGRGKDVDIRLEDPGASRRHAQISLEPTPTITDLNSTNGTYVDGQRITTHALVDGSSIRMGATQLTFRTS